MNTSNKNLKPPGTFQRWNIHARLQHIGIFSSFIALALTGLPIKFHYLGWAAAFTEVFSGFDSMLNWHLFSAFILITASFYHIFWQIGRMIQGNAAWKVLPTLKDFTDLADHLKFQLGLSDKPAQFDKYSYKEKFDYWAVFWGMFIIGVSGLIMWFPEWGAVILPRWVVDCSRIGHSDEAVLAVVVIAVWHLYNVHFNPDFFPMSRTWFDGKMDLEVMKHEHPYELAKMYGDEITSKQQKVILPEDTMDKDKNLGG